MSYKLVEYNQLPVMKLSTDKISMPGKKQVFRYLGDRNLFNRDVIGSINEDLGGAEHLLKQVLLNGTQLIDKPNLQDIQDRFRDDLGKLDWAHQHLYNPVQYPVTISPNLQALTDQVHNRLLKSNQ